MVSQTFGGRRGRETAPALPHPMPPVDPGRIASAQLIHDVRNQLSIVVGCADHLAWFVPRGPADSLLDEISLLRERSSAVARELLVEGAPHEPRRRIRGLNHVITPAR